MVLADGRHIVDVRQVIRFQLVEIVLDFGDPIRCAPSHRLHIRPVATRTPRVPGDTPPVGPLTGGEDPNNRTPPPAEQADSDGVPKHRGDAAMETVTPTRTETKDRGTIILWFPRTAANPQCIRCGVLVDVEDQNHTCEVPA
jgi:hypothetical protein